MPVQLDYRGRAYCLPMLSPQGADYVRALLEFSEGKPVGERGAMWIGIQAATLWDGEYRGKKLSKASFQDRYDWTLENEAFLRSVVDDPLGDRSWTKADKPFMFLRTAADWIGFLDQGDTFVSHVPIALDGSCSGVQHYAAILRDEETGSRVNLIPSDEPSDVYGDVSDMLRPIVEADDDPLAAFWREHGISRKEVKKPVMTYGYHSREAGFAKWYKHQFVIPTLKAQGRNEPSDPIARYLAKRTMEAVELTLPSVAAGMDWLITCSNLLAHEGKAMSWIAPSGFPVVQKYVDVPSVPVDTKLGGVRLRVHVPGTPSPTINKRKQANAIAPNHTHSLDAAHLMLTVLQADEYGVTSFALIHDSFGTLAADADAMFSATRDAFVDMYTNNDPFQHMYDQVHEALSEKGRSKLPLPPAKGNLDITQVQQSMYAFA
jgi:DNA-directed RNA polymerase